MKQLDTPTALAAVLAIVLAVSSAGSAHAQRVENDCLATTEDGPFIYVTQQAFLDNWSCGPNVPAMEIQGEDITSLAGLSSLESAEFLRIAGTRLTDLSGLENLRSAGGLWIEYNFSLTSLNGLSGLTTIGARGLNIAFGNALPTLDGLQNLSSIDGPIWVNFNPFLSECNCGLSGMIAGDPPSFTNGDFVSIGENAPGGMCNAVVDVLNNPCTPPPPQGTYDIYAVDVRTGETTRLTFLDDTDEYNAAMSPNGKTVVHEAYGSLYLTDVRTGVSTPLAGGEGGNDARFSPNGKSIAFDRDNNLYVVPAQGGTATLVREGARSGDWSNDSKRLVFQDVAWPESIRTIGIDGTGETLVAPYGEHPAWSGDGKTIAFGMYTPWDLPGGPNTAIYSVMVNHKGEPKGQPVAVTTPGPDTYDVHASFSNNGKTIAFMRIGIDTGWDADIYTVPAKGGEISRLAGTPAYGDYDPAFSNNGRYVVFSAYTEPGTAGKGFVAMNDLFAAPEVPEGFALEQNYPNPFNPSTSIHFAVPEAGQVRLAVFDVTGREVAVLVDRPMEAGSHSITWSAAAGLPSGTYLYRLTAGGVSQTRLLTLVK